MGLDSKIQDGRLYTINRGQIEAEPDSWTDYIKIGLGFPVEKPSIGWLSTVKRTISTVLDGTRVCDKLIQHYNVQKNLIVKESQDLIKLHKKLDENSNIHNREILLEFTNRISGSINGLEKLCKTYQDRNENRFVAEMEEIIGVLKNQIKENMLVINSTKPSEHTQNQKK